MTRQGERTGDGPPRRPPELPAGPAADAWEKLFLGNARFVAGVLAPRAACATVRDRLRERQTPFAAVLSCSDSRVAPELVFDLELGDVFVVRTAGHAVDEVVEATLRFGVEELSIPLVVVLGHVGCAAVAMAASSADDRGSVLLRAIRPAVERVRWSQPGTVKEMPARDALLATVDEHVLLTAERLRAGGALGPAIERVEGAVVGGRYDLATGEVTWLAR
jgi:carbonic anhydrase